MVWGKINKPKKRDEKSLTKVKECGKIIKLSVKGSEPKGKAKEKRRRVFTNYSKRTYKKFFDKKE